MVKKIVLTAAVAVLIIPAFASAQSSVTATATVGNPAAVTGSGNLDFGTVSRASDNVIDAAGGAGAATRTVEFNHNIRVTCSNVPANLTFGALTLPVALT